MKYRFHISSKSLGYFLPGIDQYPAVKASHRQLIASFACLNMVAKKLHFHLSLNPIRHNCQASFSTLFGKICYNMKLRFCVVSVLVVVYKFGKGWPSGLLSETAMSRSISITAHVDTKVDSPTIQHLEPDWLWIKSYHAFK